MPVKSDLSLLLEANGALRPKQKALCCQGVGLRPRTHPKNQAFEGGENAKINRLEFPFWNLQRANPAPGWDPTG